MQRWRRLGHVYVASGESDWLTSHAGYPTPLSLPDGRLRVFFSPRDSRGRSSIFSMDLLLDGAHFERLGPPAGPWLEPGPRGAFDDAGASSSCILAEPDGGLTCYYLGWELGVSIPFRTTIGMARAAPGESRFTRASPVPLLDRSAEDPFVLGYPWALRDQGKISIWYGTHLSWGEQWMATDHVIRRATSCDGLSWRRDLQPALFTSGSEEFALSRPSVLRDADLWRMWYCRRLPIYELGYATSADGITWQREDFEVAFPGASPEWEAGVRTYPAVFDHAGRRYMLYNGTGYGRSGFGLAMLERD
ncbi:MAG: hypothetical protein JWR10_4457 [Rubritepida sp.]|nr:hypothetical protein [Rubritepida sp.]